MADVVLDNIRVTFGNKEVIREVSARIPGGKYTVIVGPSGCGKSVLLRTIAGLERLRSGRVSIGGRLVNAVSPSDRNVAMVFQHFALYQHMTVYDNLAFSLRVAKIPPREVNARVLEVAELLHMSELLKRLPRHLSGGQKQRVALGRALVRRPEVFLFDEPLGALDAKLRAEMVVELKRIQQELGITTIHVTHDQIEAQALGDQIAVLNAGKLEQYGTAEEIYDRPANTFVAGFMGSPAMNFLECSVQGETITLEANGFNLSLPPGKESGLPASGPAILGIRPEDLVLSRDAELGAFPAKVLVIEPYSDELVLDLDLGRGTMKALAYREQLPFRPQLGQTVAVRVRAEKMHIFSET